MQHLDAAAVRAWAAACVRSLQQLRADIDGINVYPVADSDTGSNLLHTFTAAETALTERPEVATAGTALRVLATGAVAAARGNSGVILSQFLRGLAEEAGDAARLDGPALAAALRRADELATGAVARPVAGTMLSVLHAVGTAVDDVATLPETTRTASRTAAEALSETPRQLAALAAAGVVDAGGRGLLAVFDALEAVVAGEAVAPERPVVAPPAAPAPQAWEVMYLLSDLRPGEQDAALDRLRRDLAALGDSVTVAGDGQGSHAVHVHCDDIGAALEAGLRHGRPHRVRVEPLMTPAPPDSTAAGRAVVVVLRGEGVVDLVAGEGVPVLAAGDGPAGPTVEQLLGLVGETEAGHVTVVPGGVDLTAVAERAAGHPVLADRDVVVVPCASPVQALSALAVHDPERRAGADVVAMAEAAAATRRGDIVVAAEDAITWVGHARAGDVLGMVDGEVVHIAESDRVVDTALDVLERMLAVGGELVTVLTGAGAPEGIDDILAERLRADHPEVELVCYYGGQADAVLLMGVE